MGLWNNIEFWKREWNPRLETWKRDVGSRLNISCKVDPCHINLVQLTSGKLWRYRSQQPQKVQNIPRSGDPWANSWLSPSLEDLKMKLFIVTTWQYKLEMELCFKSKFASIKNKSLDCIFIITPYLPLSWLSVWHFVRQIMNFWYNKSSQNNRLESLYEKTYEKN